MRQIKMFLKVSFLPLIAIVLAACAEEDTGIEEAGVSTFEMNLDGHWTVTEATLDGEPVIDLAEAFENELLFDVDDYTSGPEGNRELDVAFYYDNGLLTIVDSEGDTIELSYQVVEKDEENQQITLEYLLNDEDVEIYIDDVVSFYDEGARITTQTNVQEVVFLREEDEEPSEYEEELATFGGRAALEFIYGLDLELELEYLSDETTPVE